MKEKWIPAYGFPKYEVSSEGRIRNFKTGKILKTQINQKGYEVLTLMRNGRQHTVRVHRLVAESFYGSPHDGMYVKHIDDDVSNNKASNLEFSTRKEIIRHAIERGTMSKNDYGKPRIRVRDITTGIVYNSLNECERDTGIDHSEISKYISGKIKYPIKGHMFERII